MSDERHANRLETWVKSEKEGLPPVLAATVILLRDGPTGLETLMLRRNSKIVFGGMWVFPGGRLDPEDWEGVKEGDELAASRRAATRESVEETGLEIDPDLMVPFSHWTPPLVTPKRFLTWFFAARAGDGEVQIDHGEIHESDWMAPAEALRRQNLQQIELAPPTYVSLAELSAWNTVEHALDAVGARTPERFQTRISVVENVGPVTMWHGDAGYEAGDASIEGPRHRLTMAKKGPWLYDRTD